MSRTTFNPNTGMAYLPPINVPNLNGDVFGYYREDTSTAHQKMHLEMLLTQSMVGHIPVEICIVTGASVLRSPLLFQGGVFKIDKPHEQWQLTELFGGNGEYFIGQKQPVAKVYADGSIAHQGSVARKWRLIQNYDYAKHAYQTCVSVATNGTPS